MTKLLGTSTIFALAATLLAGGCSGDPSSPGALSQPQAASHVRPDQQNYGGPPEMFNQTLFYVPSGPTPTNYEIQFLGDWTPYIGTPIAVPATDPFCASTTCTPVVTVANGVTTVSWSGPTLFQNAPNGGYHFGLSNEPPAISTQTGPDGCQSMEQCSLGQHWSYPTIPPAFSNGIAVYWHIPTRKCCKVWTYGTVFLQAGLTKKGPALFDLWVDVPYSPDGSKQPKLHFMNPGPVKLYVLSSGIALNQPIPSDPDCLKNPDCPQALATLASLNVGGYPPPGEPSSHFIPLNNPPKVLKPSKR
jgi:hypothetical protein